MALTILESGFSYWPSILKMPFFYSFSPINMRTLNVLKVNLPKENVAADENYCTKLLM